MAQRIHIFGASGSGTSTLGAHLAQAIGGRHLDTDAYYWHKTDPPFTQKRDPAERIRMIERDIQGTTTWVLSGAICGWGEPLLHHLTLAVFLYLDPVLRMARIAERERTRYGSRLLPGADMHEQHVAFMAWAGSYDHAKPPTRSLDLHERWMLALGCPMVRLDSAKPTQELCEEILQRSAT